MPHIDLDLPFPSRISPYLDQVRAAHTSWVQAMGVVTPGAATDEHLAHQTCEMVALIFPQYDLPGVQLIADATGGPLMKMNDHFTAVTHSVEQVNRARDRYLSVMTVPPGRPPADPDSPGDMDLDPVARAWLDVWARQSYARSPAWQERVRANWIDWIDANVEEAEHNRNGHVLDKADYFRLRRRTIGTEVWYDLREAAGRFELPARVRDSGPIRAMHEASSDVMWLINEIFSLERDEADGVLHNLVFILQHQQALSRAQAIAEVKALIGDRVSRFQHHATELPALHDDLSLTATEAHALTCFVDGMQSLIRGNYDMSRTAGRYAEVK
ncbi:hypothetical protein ACFQ08_01950 [Streptosporangium algeriense]|uniref:Terpene synthase n=1 Tax=Streptosporangium algeriense TaxID=1682748 RepID=A0ABW3DJZ6_9ACTN